MEPGEPSIDELEKSDPDLVPEDVELGTVDPVAEESDADEIDEIAPPTPVVLLTWSQIESGTDNELPSSTATLAITNNTDADEPIEIDLRWVGDAGTTKSYTGEMDSVVVEPGGEVEVNVDLSAIFPTLDAQQFSGYLHVVARPKAVKGDVPDQVVSTPLYFHQVEDVTLAYDEETLLALHRAGDFEGLSPRTADLMASEEDSALVRVVADESADAPGEPMLIGDRLAGPPEGLLPSGTTSDSLTQSSDPQFAHSQRLCAYFTVETVDSGYTNASGYMEDYWTNANNGIITFGYGVKVKIGSTTYDTDPLGCVNFTSPNSTYVADVVVYTYATDVNGNYVRIHNGPSNSTASFPGTTYSILHVGVSFSSGTTKVLNVGGYQSRWTAMATLAYSLANYNNGMTNAEFHVSDLAGQNPDVDLDCGANFNYFNDVANNESYIKLVTINSTYCPKGHNQKNKFVVSHEYGHGYGFQIAELATQSPADAGHSATPNGTCSFTMNDADPLAFPYNNNTKEWSSLAIREGFAHFVSARLWNNAGTSAPNTEGQLRWGGSIDLERWDPSYLLGGHLVNACCPASNSACATSLNGAGVLTDWMRAFWDIHTDSTCAISKSNIPLLYALTILQSGLTDQNFFPKSQNAAAVVGCANRWSVQGCRNGIDRQGAIWAGC